MELVSPHVERLVVEMFGDEARRWLSGLDAQVGRACRRWGLEVVALLEGAGVSSVLEVRRRDGTAAVLKLAPGPVGLEDQVRALVEWRATAGLDGGLCPVVRVLASTGDEVLLEMVDQAAPVSPGGVPGAEELAVVGRMLELSAGTDGTGLWSGGLDHSVRDALGWLAGCDDPEWSERARGLAEVVGLARSAVGEVRPSALCHGDLWPPNVLASRGRWCVIDPWPQAGEAASDAGFWAATAGWGEGAELRCEALAPHAGCSPERVWAYAALWAAVRVALSLGRGLSLVHADGLAAVAERWRAGGGRL